MEYANSGTLRDYLRNNFHILTWKDKHNMAFQLAHAVLCLHDEGIVHRDLVIHLYLTILKYIITYLSIY
jgi:serine/threonine protein kinase